MKETDYGGYSLRRDAIAKMANKITGRGELSIAEITLKYFQNFF